MGVPVHAASGCLRTSSLSPAHRLAVQADIVAMEQRLVMSKRSSQRQLFRRVVLMSCVQVYPRAKCIV
eukprot:756886-Hanusia_phi.AAC.4